MCRLILGTALLGQLAVAVRAVQDRLRLEVRRLTFGTALRDQLAVAVRAVQEPLSRNLGTIVTRKLPLGTVNLDLRAAAVRG